MIHASEEAIVPEEIQNHEDGQVLANDEISINYASTFGMHSMKHSMVHHIRNACGLPLITSIPTTIYEDNAACIEQIKEGYIKGDKTKHISPKFFFTHELQKSHEIEVKQIR